MNSDEFTREEGHSGHENARKGRKRKEKEKRYACYLSRERTTRLDALREGRKKGRRRCAAIYKVRHHRNWTSLRKTEEHDTWEVGSEKKIQQGRAIF